MIRFVGLFLLAAATNAASAADEAMSINAVADVFQSRGIDATLVVQSSDQVSTHVYNLPRAEQRLSPASTFKVPNTLVALDQGIVDGAHSPFKWDGVDRGVEQWNRDQTLATALKFSCVWCYQEIAKAAGEGAYEQALRKLEYGNENLGAEVDMFWLNGDLTISAMEQIDLLRRIVNYDLPFKREHVDVLKNIMLVEENADYAIFGKTGWTGSAVTPQVGWYIGFVEKSDQVWLFAMNMQIDNREQVGLRVKLAMEALEKLGII